MEYPIKRVNDKSLRCLIENYQITILNPCRRGKKLLVLDIDHTLSDHTTSEDPMRPYLHEFLSVTYAKYDIIIWSASRMKKIKSKLEQLGVINSPNYNIVTLLDRKAMLMTSNIIKDRDSGRSFTTCKPLHLIWAKFSEFYDPRNTIMVDDMEKNFKMNPQNGLTIKAFWKHNYANDEELCKLAQYLLAISEHDDLSSLDHKCWEKYLTKVTQKGNIPPSYPKTCPTCFSTNNNKIGRILKNFYTKVFLCFPWFIVHLCPCIVTKER
ncbi:unnamed protein product [Cuscuta epithymum]|uniref:FCP1 homology domain-containing protein n=1 Tax=Cuscuta epithymum TaxID=186058 RepID=A0AAV0FWY0_9ASTE|nr:unnamed protein product [Cuscuta epithymum]